MNITQFQHVLKAADLANDSVIVESLHGIGKSDSVKQFAKEHDYHLEELFLSMLDTGDLMGIPRTQVVGTSTITTWAEPDFFQRITDAAFPQINKVSDLVFEDKSFEEFFYDNFSGKEITRTELNPLYCKHYDLVANRLQLVSKDSTVYSIRGKRSILFLDELNRSNLDVRQAALQLILNKELHSHKLPFIKGECTIITAAINPADEYQVDELDPALLDRFLHVTLEPDTKEWLAWARSANINDVVQAYLAENPTKLHWTPKDGGIGATPRSWAKLASFMDNITKFPKEIHFTLMKGKIGSALAGEFLSFYNNYSKVVKIEDVEKLVEKRMKTSKNPEVIAKHIEKLISKQEAIQKNQLAEALYEKYIKKGDNNAEAAMPCVAFLYALEIELLTSFLKARKEADHVDYMKLANFDSELNNKKLYKKITTKLSS